jgi:predicted MPP superfamily phosphohydrolase
MNRREFLKYGLRLTILSSMGLGFYEKSNLKTEFLQLGFPNLPDSFDGYRICHISDLHSSFWVKKNYLMEMIKKINALKCEVVVITGDIITDDMWFSYDFAKAMRNVPIDEFKIVLSHNPDVRRDISTDMKVDLTLCGHTHGGQVMIPFNAFQHQFHTKSQF